MTTEEITSRIVASLLPFSSRFYNLYNDKADLYGPFWIYTTLVMVLAVAGNLNNYLHQLSDDSNFKYEF